MDEGWNKDRPSFPHIPGLKISQLIHVSYSQFFERVYKKAVGIGLTDLTNEAGRGQLKKGQDETVNL